MPFVYYPKLSPDVINVIVIKLNIILPRMSNFSIKQKKTRTICFIICHQDQARSGKVKAIFNKSIFFFLDN